jgi:hypothetical protein
MEENIQKILNEKDENVVQFNVTNTTSSPVFIDLFDSANLSPVANSVVYSSLPNTPTSSFGTLAYQYLSINPNNGYLYATDGSNLCQVFDTNNGNVLVTNIIFPTASVIQSCYNSIDNTLYFVDSFFGFVYVVNAITNAITTTIPYLGGGANAILYIPNTNSIYLSVSLGTIRINCSTNTISPTTLLPYSDFAFNSTNGLVYAVENSVGTFVLINPFTDIIIQTIFISSPASIGINSNINTPYAYISDLITGDIYIYNWNTGNSFVGTLIPSVGNIARSVYDSFTNRVYFGTNTGNLLIINSDNTFQTSFIALSFLLTEVINSNLNLLYTATPFTNNIFQITTLGITATPYYISGSANYNAFVNNLNNEPVFIQMIRLLVQNQNQLTNELQLTKIDSNGNQIFMPNFPINEVSAYQRKGNIGEITLKDVVFDGRTYINNYELNAYETISFEIYYKQLDLTTATATYPIFFKAKVQLKEYIKKQLNL